MAEKEERRKARRLKDGGARADRAVQELRGTATTEMTTDEIMNLLRGD